MKRTIMYTALWVFPLLCILTYYLFFFTIVAVVAFFTFWIYILFVFAILTRARLDIMKKQSQSRGISRIKQLKNIILFIMSVAILIFTVLILLAYAIVYT